VLPTPRATLPTLPSMPKTVSRLKMTNPYESTAITEVRVGGADARAQEVGAEERAATIPVDSRALPTSPLMGCPGKTAMRLCHTVDW
jgi:hypothetical protein